MYLTPLEEQRYYIEMILKMQLRAGTTFEVPSVIRFRISYD